MKSPNALAGIAEHLSKEYFIKLVGFEFFKYCVKLWLVCMYYYNFNM